MSQRYRCCTCCQHRPEWGTSHSSPCTSCSAGALPLDYVEEATANPERQGNGCQIYKRGTDAS